MTYIFALSNYLIRVNWYSLIHGQSIIWCYWGYKFNLMNEAIVNLAITIKAVGFQWYWSIKMNCNFSKRTFRWRRFTFTLGTSFTIFSMEGLLKSSLYFYGRNKVYIHFNVFKPYFIGLHVICVCCCRVSLDESEAKRTKKITKNLKRAYHIFLKSKEQNRFCQNNFPLKHMKAVYSVKNKNHCSGSNFL